MRWLRGIGRMIAWAVCCRWHEDEYDEEDGVIWD